MFRKIFVTIFCVILLNVLAYASIEIKPYASMYINSCENKLSATGSSLSYTLLVNAYDLSDTISISGELQELKNGNWTTVSTFGNTANNRFSYSYSGSYTGTKGSTYRVYATFYVKIGTGSETKTTYSEMATIK